MYSTGMKKDSSDNIELQGKFLSGKSIKLTKSNREGKNNTNIYDEVQGFKAH